MAFCTSFTPRASPITMSTFRGRLLASHSGPTSLRSAVKCASFGRRNFQTTRSMCLATNNTAPAVTKEEREGWEKRMEEAGQEAGASIGGWEWTLNWNFITPNLIVGSCPRSAEDVDTLVEKAGVSAIVNLQSNVCFDALQIPAAEIRSRALENGVYWERVPTLDFNKGDQAMMLPEAVRKLNFLLHRGLTVYCHCTAGINRATLAALGYLTFVQGMSLTEGVAVIKSARPVAHPYIECWNQVHKKILDGRDEELSALAVEIYGNRCAENQIGDAASDWTQAQRIATARLFQRWLEVDILAFEMEAAMAVRQSVEQAAAFGREEEELPSAGQLFLEERLAEAENRLGTVLALLDQSERQLAESRILVGQSQQQLGTAQSQLASCLTELAGALRLNHGQKEAQVEVSLQILATSNSSSTSTGTSTSDSAGEDQQAAPEGHEQSLSRDEDSEDSAVSAAVETAAGEDSSPVQLQESSDSGASAAEEEESVSAEDDMQCNVITRTCVSADSAEEVEESLSPLL